MITKLARKARRHNRVRARLHGSKAIPRLSIAITNQHVIAQLIDDEAAKTLVYSSSMGKKLAANISERAGWVGEDIAKKAKGAKIKKIVFDRGPRRYHGRIKVFAEAARKGGLEF